ncbi:MAG TPA: helix-hairpin-helix domain-containing protein [Bryobacteraceae bacterium]|nr:helix-hairpin-helix domain-containing protein [Bryobacteraceae bacterium]
MKRLILLALASAFLLWCADPEVEKLPPGKGKEVIAAVCTDCHGVANIRRQRLSREEWTSEVSDMVDRGADAKEDQIAVILDYLTENFGKNSKLRVNTAPMIELKAVLELTAAEAGAIVDYRTAHGDFHSVEELLKVPGVPGGKIEAKKEVLGF